ncbi:TetR/AcrR family transcriptional regulator [Streptomyces sp. NPDC050529]|uniref:TetR/AcrR family transcriptional regulator n=1 Tax=unclassified Streptomyces TaxID=2593676 RepID=UPI002DDBE25D|nr:helix-turn-helix domain-containing protein [Streptomyces sp. NBC_01022]WRZ80324.1 TetR/AcrR family transcriptional regulator [Streptomyces sp. NBC_01022]
MARVSQEHLDARRRQILDGAARCFARDGFHATSMQDVLKEVGLSAGAVYRYFTGKEDLIAAIAGEAVGGVRLAFERAARVSPPPTPDVLIGRVVRTLFGEEAGGRGGLDRRAYAGLIVQVWSETLRSERLAATLGEAYAGLRISWAELVGVYRESGILAAEVPDEDIARTLIATAQGFITQLAMFGDATPELLESGLRGLMSMDLQRVS